MTSRRGSSINTCTLVYILAIFVALSLPLTLAQFTRDETTHPSSDSHSARPHSHILSHIDDLVTSHGGVDRVRLAFHPRSRYVSQLVLTRDHKNTPSHGRARKVVHSRHLETTARQFFTQHGGVFGIPNASAQSPPVGKARFAAPLSGDDHTIAQEDRPDVYRGATTSLLSQPTEGELMLDSTHSNNLTGTVHLKFKQVLYRNHSLARRIRSRADPATRFPSADESIQVFGSALHVAFDSFGEMISVVGHYMNEAHYVARTDIRVGRLKAIRAARIWVIKNIVPILRQSRKDRNEHPSSQVEDESAYPPIDDATFLESSYVSMLSQLTLSEGPFLTIFHTGMFEGLPPTFADPTNPSSNSTSESDVILCYQMILQTASRAIDERIFVSALTGTVVFHHPMTNLALARRIGILTGPSASSFSVAWSEGNNFPTGNSTFDTILNTTADFYNLFASMTRGSWLSYNGKDGMMMALYDQYSRYLSCPNAYYTSGSTIFCPTLIADDIIAHEWAHGITASTSVLIYAFQSGALNEGLSDIFAEVIDMLNGHGSDAPSLPRAVGSCVSNWRTNVRWQVGEDAAAATSNSPIRDMWSPECRGAAGSTSSTSYYCATTDSGGVHYNSGIIARAFAFLVDGVTYNGVTVKPIGLTKATHIYFTAQRFFFSSTSDFFSAAGELFAACSSLIGQQVPDFNTKSGQANWPTTSQTITADDCAQVNQASDAVGMRIRPQCIVGYLMNPHSRSMCAATSASGQPLRRVDYFTEDFESGTFANHSWLTSTRPVHPSSWDGRTWQIARLKTNGRTDLGAFAPNPNTGDCRENDQSGVQILTSPNITIPPTASGTASAPAQLAFDHFFTTETYFDGGNIKYSVNGQPFVIVPKSYFTYNPYTNTLIAAPDNTNPLASEAAFTGSAMTSGQTGVWATSVIQFPSNILKPGDNVTLQWEMGTDACTGVTGWYIDNIYLYQCVVDYCRTASCQNGATCVNTATSALCRCAHGFTGATCTTPPAFVAYNWTTSNENFVGADCSVECGGGIRTRQVECIETTPAGSVSVASSYCDSTTRPASSQPCNTQLCPTYVWQYSNYSDCSSDCVSTSAVGVANRAVTGCIDEAAGVKVEDRYCQNQTIVHLTRPCHTSCSYQYDYGEWKSCVSNYNSTCGAGRQQRDAKCRIEAITLIKDDSNHTLSLIHSNMSYPLDVCNSRVASSPFVVRPCSLGVCVYYRVVEVGDCLPSCQSIGTRHRRIICSRRDRPEVVPDQLCETMGLIKPNASITCTNDLNLTCSNYEWSLTPFTPCDAECGIGVTYRNASCVDRTTVPSSAQSTVPDSYCQHLPTPVVTTICSAANGECHQP